MKAAEGYRQVDWVDPRIEVRPSPLHGKGMFARAPIRQGEVVTVWGGTLLLTEDDIAGLTDYINHSCDPNVWMLDEVTLAARRDIPVGEELTIDYCLFEGDEDHAPPWTCRCGTTLCRGRFTGRDWRRADLQERYLGHFSPFIRARIEGGAQRGRADDRGEQGAG